MTLPLWLPPWIAVPLTILGKVPRQVWIMLAAAILVAVGLRYVYNKGVVSQQAETAEVQTKLDTALDANKSNLDTIAKLQDANERLAKGAEADRREAAKAVTKLETDKKALTRALAAEKNRRSHIYATDPTAATVGATVVPDALVSGLRDGSD